MAPKNKEAFNSQFKNAEEWLIKNGFVITYSNHPNSILREFHFIKDQIRIKLFIGLKDSTYFCNIETPIDPYNLNEPVIYLTTKNYTPGDVNILKAHSFIKRHRDMLEDFTKTEEPINVTKSSIKEDSKQTLWETWFVASVVILLGLIFIGTLNNSKIFMPYWPFLISFSIFNLVYCIYKGSKTKS